MLVAISFFSRDPSVGGFWERGIVGVGRADTGGGEELNFDVSFTVWVIACPQDEKATRAQPCRR